MSLPDIAFPVFLDLRKRLAVVIGQGAAAERKAHQLLKYGADVVVIGPDPSMTLVQAEAEGLLNLERRVYSRGDLAGAAIVICLEDDANLRRFILAEAAERGCLVSVPDAPDSSNFSMPSTVRRGSLQIAISTAGQVPEVARQAKMLVQDEFGEEWAEYASLMSHLRAALAATRPAEERRKVMDAVIASDVLERIREGQALDVAALVEEFGSPRAEAGQTGAVEAEAAEAADNHVEADA